MDLWLWYSVTKMVVNARGYANFSHFSQNIFCLDIIHPELYILRREKQVWGEKSLVFLFSQVPPYPFPLSM